MTETTDRGTRSIERVPTNVPGLDAILGGGFLRGGVYLLMGSPGIGKTILSNQICFLHAKHGGRATYITLLAESHSRMLSHIEGMDFYEPELIAKNVSYLSGYKALEEEKLDGLLDLIRREVRHHEATILVLDGIVTVGAIAESELALKKFIHELKAYTELTGCICLITTSAIDNGLGNYPARTMVDGLLELSLEHFGMRTARQIEISKLRGSHPVMGCHLFEVSKAGIIVHPRIEAIYGHSANVEETRERVPTGIAGLDAMLGGGMLSGSVTIVAGPPGSGKTLLGLRFLSQGAERGEAGLYVGFYETPPRLIGKAEGVGMVLGARVLDGTIAIRWYPPLEQVADAIVRELLVKVREQKTKRLVLDGLGGLAQSMLHKERLDQIVTALANELRCSNVTAIITAESGMAASESLDIPLARFSGTVDNIVLLRSLERSGRIHRSVSILKMREGESDPNARSFSITSRGLAISAGSSARPRPKVRTTKIRKPTVKVAKVRRR